MVKIMENPIKMDDLGVPLFLETPIWFVCMLISMIDINRHRVIWRSCLPYYLKVLEPEVGTTQSFLRYMKDIHLHDYTHYINT